MCWNPSPACACGLVRECPTYRVTLTDPKFLETCKEFRLPLKRKLPRSARTVLRKEQNVEGTLVSLTDHPCKLLLKTRMQEGGSGPLHPPQYLFPARIQTLEP